MLSPLIATKISPSATLRESIETPPRVFVTLPRNAPPVAASNSSALHNALAMISLAPKRRANRCMITEIFGHAANDLALLMALARDQQNIARL